MGNQGDDGLLATEQEPTVWQLGSSVEVAWAIAANHGGGYSYRLCKKSDGISEECFQRTPLKFAGNTSFVINPDGSTFEFPMKKVTQGTSPAPTPAPPAPPAPKPKPGKACKAF